jgi:dynein heavy chain
MVNNTVIDWFMPWPRQALESVAEVFLVPGSVPNEFRKEIVNHVREAHYLHG